MKVKELQSLSVEELVQKEKALRKDLSALNFQQKMGRVEKPSQFHLIRQDIARILTVVNQKQKASVTKEGTKK
jgi:large subunit ribosomal protein L29